MATSRISGAPGVPARHRCKDGPRVNRPVTNAIRVIALTAWLTAGGLAQTHTTVRHYKERIDDTPPEIAQAEDAIQKNDFPGAETLLKKAIDKDPNNYQAWFDLGFVLHRLGRTDESIAAYRKSVAAKPDVFESNLNLGLMLARGHNAQTHRAHGRRSSPRLARARASAGK